MAQYHRVSPKYWPDMRGLSTHGKLLGVYVLTCRHRNTEGYYHLPVAYAAEDLEIAAGAVRKSMAEIEKRGFVSYDPDAQVVFIHKALTYPGQAPKSITQIKGALAALSHLPDSPLWLEFVGMAQQYSTPFHLALTEGIEAAEAYLPERVS